MALLLALVAGTGGQRSDAHLTVMIEAQGVLQHSPSGVAALVDDAWSSLQ
jgi:hypothetical protein